MKGWITLVFTPNSGDIGHVILVMTEDNHGLSYLEHLTVLE